MGIVALIMAGGKGSRFGVNVEKPMVELMGKSLVKRVIEAARDSWSISCIYIAVTDRTPRTLEEASKEHVKTVKTKGVSYHADLQEAILRANLRCPVLTLSADLVFLTGRFLDEVVSNYAKSGKPALVVLSTIEACHNFGVEPASLYEHKGQLFAVSGINIVDGRKISEGRQEQEVMISDQLDAVFNVNSPRDLELAKRILKRVGETSR